MGVSENITSGKVRLALILLLAAHAALLVWSAVQNSPTVDEPGHLVAGLSHWERGDFYLYRVNPPLVRMVAVIPVLFTDVKMDWTGNTEDSGRRWEFWFGQRFVEHNGASIFRYFALARWASIPFSLLGAYICFRWATKLYGACSGLLAAGLWCFSPMILGHGQLITPDVGASAAGALACFVFWHWLRSPTWELTFFSGLTLGLAELTKTTWIVLFALWPVLWPLFGWTRWRAERQRVWLSELLQLGTVVGLSIFVLNLGYGFEGTFQPLREFKFRSRAFGAGDAARSPLADTWLGACPVPIPKNYLFGIDAQKWDFERNLWSYFRCEWRGHGWYHYYLYALAVKGPVGTWMLVGLAVFAPFFRRGYSAPWRDEAILLAPLLVILVVVSSATGMNHHLRYVLPIFPFAFIWVSKVARCISLKSWVISSLGGLAIGWSVGSSLCVYPHSLSYFNELAGGPIQGHVHLVDSNIDWGQDLLFLKRWMEEHPEAQPLRLAYFGSVHPRSAGIESSLPPKLPEERSNYGPSALENGPVPGWYAISVNFLRGFGSPMANGTGRYAVPNKSVYSYFLYFEPVARAGYSIYIYHITPEEANLVRQKLGLPVLEGSNP